MDTVVYSVLVAAYLRPPLLFAARASSAGILGTLHLTVILAVRIEIDYSAKPPLFLCCLIIAPTSIMHSLVQAS